MMHAPSLHPSTCKLPFRVASGAIHSRVTALLFCLTASLQAQLATAPQNVQLDVYDRGLIVTFDPVQTTFPAPRVSKYRYTRNGGEPVEIFYPPFLDSPLEPSTDYSYEVHGIDTTGTKITENASFSTTTRPAGEGITTNRLTQSEGTSTNGSSHPSLSADGRYLAFITVSEELVGQAASRNQIVLLDRQSGQYQLISRKGAEMGNNNSDSPSISANGRYIAFVTTSTNLADVETPAGGVFVYDRQTSAMTLVSKATDGTGPNKACLHAAISDDGSTVAFVTDATNLIAGSTDTRRHAYVVDLDDLVAERITSDGTSGSLSHTPFVRADEVGLNGDGSLVTYRGFFSPDFANLQILNGNWLYDRSTGETSVLTAQPGGQAARGFVDSVADLTPDGRYAVFSYRKLTSQTQDAILPGIGEWGTIYLLDRVTGTYEFVAIPALNSLLPAGSPQPAGGAPTISDDGRLVTFVGDKTFGISPNPGIDIYIRDRSLKRTIQVSRSSLGIDGDGNSEYAAISGDGSVVVFQSRANNLVDDDDSLVYPDLFAAQISLDPPDQNPPTWPEGSQVSDSNLGATLATLTWSTAVDPEDRLTGYRIYLNGDLVGATVATQRETSLTGLSPETGYTVKIEAVDNTGNLSTDGPEVEFTTKALVVGGAGLVGSTLEGGRVNLTWDPADGSVAGYTIERKTEDGSEWTEVTEVAGNIVTFTDTDLPASTQVSYRILVRLIGETEKNLHSRTQSVTTRDLYISAFSVDIPHEPDSVRTLARSGTLAFMVTGEAARAGFIEIDFRTWPEIIAPETEPTPSSAMITLAESAEQAGAYTAAWTIPDRLVDVNRVAATLQDGHGSQVSAVSKRFPRSVGAGFSIDVTIHESISKDSPDVTAAVWSDKQLAGRSRIINGSATFAGSGLPPGNDYRFRFYHRGHMIYETVAQTLHPALVTTLESITLENLSPAFRVTDPLGIPRENVRVTVFKVGSNLPAGSVITDQDGNAVLEASALYLRSGQEIKVVLSKSRWDLGQVAETIPLPAPGEIIAIMPPWSEAYKPPGVVSGSVRFDDGSPAAGATVTFTSIEPGIFSMTDVMTDSEGNYSNGEVYGKSGLNVTSRNQTEFASKDLQVTANPATDTIVNVILEKKETYRIVVDRIELIDSVGTVRRFRPSEAPHLTRLMGMSLVRKGATQTEAAKELDAGSMSIETRIPRGTEFTLFVDGYRLGYSPGSVVLTAGEATTLHVELIQLRMDQQDFIFGQLVGPDGNPIHSRFPWTANTRFGTAWVTESDQFFGFGPNLILPRSTAGPYELNISTGDLTSFPVLGQKVRVDGPTGPIDLGEIRFLEPGRFARGSRFRTTPDLVIPGQTIVVELHAYNSSQAPVHNAVVTLPLPEGVNYVEGSLAIDGNPATPLETDGRLVLRFPSKTDFPDLDLPLVPADADVFGRWTIARSEFRLMVDSAFSLSRLNLAPSIDYQAGDEATTETIGVVDLEVITDPTISGPKVVSGHEITVKGRSRAGRIIVLDGETPIGQTEVSRAGYWTLATRLTDPKTPYWHTLRARWVDSESGSERVSSTLEVLRNPYVVRPVRVRVRQPVEEADTPEEIALVKRWEDVGPWTEFEVPESGPARFWKRILAGFPFQLEVEFNRPDDVRDVSFQIAGSAGGSGKAVRGDDGVYRARIESRRNVEWDAGEITVTYTPLGNADFPKWGNTVRIGTDIVLLGEEPSPSTLSDSSPLQAAGTDFGYRANASIGSDFTATVETRFRAAQPIPVDPITTIDYPYGSIAAGTPSVGSVGGSVTWSISGPNISVNASFSIAAAEFTRRDRTTPVWSENADLSVISATETTMWVGWGRALDDTWIETYVVSIGGDVVAEIEGDQFEFELTGLESGQTYEISVEAVDAADKSTGSPLRASVEFSGPSTNGIRPGRPIAYAELPQSPLIIEPPRAASAGGLVKVTANYIGHVTTGVSVLNWYNGVESSDDRFDRWDDQLDAAGECGASPADLANIKNEMDQATEAIVVENITSTTFTAVSVGVAFTGAGIPVSVGLEVAGIAIDYMLESASREEANEVEAALSEALKECEEEEEECPPGIDNCDDEDDDPAPTRSPVANPTWKIDPSGYVFEVLETNRLEGVTATLLEGESENGPWVFSDAEAFGEINPQITPDGGIYRWDVPAGWWRVMYAKEGYDTAFSEALPVPPPHFDVNIPLKSLAPPEVTAVDSLNNGAALQVAFANHIRAAMASTDTVRVRAADGTLVDGHVHAPANSLVDNPHTETTAMDITTRILFVPDTRLVLGETYTAEIDGVIESYGEVPMGETAEFEVTITDDRAGTWFGTFDPGGGLWTMRISEDGTATLSGYDPGTGTQIDADGIVDGGGNLSIDLGSLVSGASLAGTLTDGALTGSVSVLGYTVSGNRSQGEAASEDGALTYQGAVIGSTRTTVTVTLGPDGTVLALIDGELTTSAATASIDDAFQFSGFLSDGSELELDLSDPEGTMSGVLSLVGSGSWSVLGATEGSPRARLVNVSGRGPVTAGAGSLIAGFVIRGTAENPMLVRAIGPGLETFGLTGVLEQPRIRLVDPSRPVDDNLLAENTNWLQGGNRNELRAVFAGLGAFFLEDTKSDATVYLPIKPGPYTAVVQGVDGQAGIALVEAYDADLGVFGTNSEGVANLSLRGNVGSGSGVMIAGFVIDGGSPRRLLIRGVGPGLGPLGVQNFLSDPTITLFEGNDPISDNQSWGDYLPNEGLAPIFQTVGAFPLESGSDDAAIVIWLAPGPYTVKLQNEVTGEGIGLIELYDLP